MVAFESTYHVRLPKDLRAYFATVGGMDLRATPPGDQEGFTFWPLPEVRPTAENPGAFIIADYLNLSWAYAVTLGGGHDSAGPVVFLGLTTPQTVAESFAGFVDLYLADSRQLYPG
jgi:hypothetical protein